MLTSNPSDQVVKKSSAFHDTVQHILKTCVFLNDNKYGLDIKAVDLVVDDSTYRHTKVVEWSDAILEYVIRKLTALQQTVPYKYIATCKIIQKTGTGYHTCSTGLWDPEMDGHTNYRYDTGSVVVVVDAYAVAAKSQTEEL
ncbi:hypothetical protein IWQ62_002279 [Dispira parvispora]|uniref:Uncharacterized protein n=1 Tax=Dispira parvispora TaxID=1520584 RepID=A0A9W8AWE3_9FUNG|nr:hypothetical protein IWQ62_002279 [Dispira parvispora]